MDHLGQFIINHWELWLALLGVLLLILINEKLAQKNRAKDLSPQEAIALTNQNQALIIDIRDKESFRGGHIINAINTAPDEFNHQRMDKYKEKKLIFACARGLQSQTLAAKLRKQGFNQTFILAGGMAAWQQADLPLVKGK